MCATNNGNYTDKLLALHKALIELNIIDDDQKLLEHIIDQCILLTGADFGSLMTIDQKKETLDIQVARGHKKEVREKIKLKIGEGVTGKVAETGEPQLINDVRKCKYYVEINPEVRSELAVPIKISGKLLGVISVDSSNLNHFSEIDKDILLLLGQQAGRIITNARLFSELQMRYKYQNIVLEINQIINRETSFPTMVRYILRILKEKLNLMRAFLVLPEVSDAELQITEGIGITKRELARGRYKPGEGIIGTVFKTGKALGVWDIRKEPLFLNRLALERDAHQRISFIAVPIFSSNEVVGVLSAEKIYSSHKEFNEEKELFKLVSSLLSNHISRYLTDKKERLLIKLENERLRREILKQYNFSDIIGISDEIQSIFEKAMLVADTSAPILITGESGTGKELLARAIHNNSSRRDKPFVAINCAAIPEALLESELFGYKKGAFTGATSDYPGKLIAAHGGTLFLDEIGDMSIHLQSKMLRVLQEMKFEPLGSNKTVTIDVRIIAATNKDLEEQIGAGKFREDLYYRLNVVNIHLPPLRQRSSDIPLLVQHFIEKHNKNFQKNIKSISPDALELLLRYNWPGNIRELENAIAQAILLARSNVITKDLLPERILNAVSEIPHFTSQSDIDTIIQNNERNLYRLTVEEFEKIVILKTLKKYNFNKSKTAEALGINRNTLREKIRKYEISV